MTNSKHCVEPNRTGTRRGTGARFLAITAAAAAFLAMGTPAGAQQEYDVRGSVADSASGSLENAMVVALSREDSVLVKYALTNSSGNFVLENLLPGEYILQVTLIGYAAMRSDFDVTDADVDLGAVTMTMEAIEVDSLVVSIEHVPFINRRDTLSYNIDAFPTPPNALVEDLLRRLPGIDVDTDGTITAQGQEVQNVLVEGKEFFGRDPRIATRNLPADAVKQVDVYDKQSDMAEFTGIPDGEDERTIDLRLREEARVGYFGRATGGFGGDVNNAGRLGPSIGNDPVGNHLRYDGRFNLNRFSPTQQLALTANTNNVNQEGFSWEDGGGRGGGGNDGFTESLGLGLNGSRDFGSDNTWLRGSYFLSAVDNEQNRTLQQQALFGANVASQVDETRDQESGNNNHRLNLNGQYTFSPGHQLRIRANVNAGSSSSESFQNRVTQTANGQPLNTAETTNLVESSQQRGDVRLTWRKRLGDGGRSLVAEYRGALQNSDRVTDLDSKITGESRGGGDQERHILQEQNNLGETWNNSGRFSLTQRLGDSFSMEVFGRANTVDQDQDQSVYDLTGDERIRNPDLSSGFERAYSYINAGTRLSRNSENSWVTLGVRGQRSSLKGTIVDRDETITSGYTHVLANLDFRWQFKEDQTISFEYDGSTNEPSLTELQPFVDNRDPINVYIGNPDLQPEYTHEFEADYRFFDQFSFLNVFMRTGFDYTTNPIARARVFDDQGFQTITPINTDPEWSANTSFSFGTPIRRLGVDVDLDYRISYSKGWEQVNRQTNQSRELRNSVEASLENRTKDRFDLRVGANFTFNDVEYSLNQSLNRDYVNSRYFANGTLYLGAWTFGSTFNWRVYDEDIYSQGGQAGGESYSPGRDVARWDASASRRLLNDRVELQIDAYDLLNQNQAVSISNSASFIEELRTESLGQYFMVRIMYRLGMRGGFGRPGRGGGRGR
ncbi:MAG: TonB-dependent receptor [Gemmatimonadetes bacterium]|nr:TonB-dependent receptor [Gemmatimonadota bacterium]MYB98800.1 TonB-dependent receptor [Gemmatimonadota bacterium]MYH52793.1 TonB-dependent receptor [Gemmatimonadota bacterium]MYK65502.1 TonB-dependent receptor [Gemmatimonadota bacterium]